MQNSLFYPSKKAQWTFTRWKKAENIIAKLQHRIAKATLEGNYRKIRNLQRLLVQSLSARLKAVRQVAQENKRRNTPGIDGELWTTPKLKLEAAFLLHKRSKTKPLRRIYIPKKDGSTRSFGIPVMSDRARQALWNLALLPVVESTSDPVSYGFRPFRGCWDAHAQIRGVLSHKDAAQWVLDGETRKCFDTINHEWLLKNTPMEIRILRSCLKSGFLDSGEFFTNTEGTPQGGIISSTLANHVLNGMFEVLKSAFPRKQVGKTSLRTPHSSGVNLIRYADNFVVTGRSCRQLQEVKKVLSEFLRPRGLDLHPQKTCIYHIHDGFHFLGWTFRKTANGYLQRFISKDAQKYHKARLRGIVKNTGNKPASALISTLNPVIQSWCNYHRCCTNSRRVWSKTNQYLYRLLWKWVCNRHNRQSRRLIYDKYWKLVGKRRTFVAPNEKDLTYYKLTPYRFTNLPIRRLKGDTKQRFFSNPKRIQS
jgi:RNA-directed DNA polymerase